MTHPEAGPTQGSGLPADVPVTGLAVACYRVPTDGPEADGTITWDATMVVLVQATAGGRTGLGWSYAAPAAARVVRDLLTGCVLGRSALDVPAANAAMVAAVRNAGRPGVAGCAVSAVDFALWDLKARLLELPLCRLLGAVHTEVPVYGSGGFTTYDDDRMAEQLGGWVHGQGISRVKIKIGESWGTCEARDLARVTAARKVIGTGAELYVDANGAYGRKQAVRVAERAREADVRWFEEPVSSDDLAGLRAVRDAVLPDVAAGEYGYDVPYFERMCAAGAVDCLQADATRCGGVTAWLRAAAVAAPTTCRSPATPPPTCMRTLPPRCQTSATWSGSTTTSGSPGCSSTVPSTRPAGWCGQVPPVSRASACGCALRWPSSTRSAERRELGRYPGRVLRPGIRAELRPGSAREALCRGSSDRGGTWRRRPPRCCCCT
jgi:L-alanine-DL-glutamate epimerase-like enolase superfamily enzyme